jgi:hypothetical protein
MRTSDFPVVPSKDSSNPIAQPPFTLSFPYSFPTSFPLMKPIRFPHLLLISSLAALPATADTVKLKNGKVYEGTATERGDVIDIEIPMGKIIDHQTVKKSDVAEFTKTLPDEKEAADLASLVPTADALTAADYEKTLKDKVDPFLKKYPVSKFRPKVDSIAKTLRDELAKTKAGDVKLDGQWLPAAELKWNDYNVKALRLLIQLRSQLKAKKPMDAYQSFAKIESSHVASTAYPKAAAEISKAMKDLSASLNAAAAEQPAKAAERAASLKSLTPDKVTSVEAAIEAEVTAFKAKVAEEKTRKVPVTSFYPYDLNSIKESISGTEKEITRLAALDLTKLTAASTKFQAGLKDFSEKAFQSAKSNFEDAVKAYPNDTFVKKMAADAKLAAENAARNASSATIPGTSAAAVTPAANPLPASGAVPAAPAPAPKPAPAKTEAPKPAPSPATVADPNPVSEPEPESNLPLFLGGGAGLLFLVAILAKFLGKKKSED